MPHGGGAPESIPGLPVVVVTAHSSRLISAVGRADPLTAQGGSLSVGPRSRR